MTTLFAVMLALSTPCQAEGQTNCHWDASVQGNGHGTSYVVFGLTPSLNLLVRADGVVKVVE